MNKLGEWPHEKFPCAPVSTRKRLNEILSRIPENLLPEFDHLRRSLFILGEPQTSNNLSENERQECFNYVEQMKRRLGGLLGRQDVEFLIRGLATDVDPDVQ